MPSPIQGAGRLAASFGPIMKKRTEQGAAARAGSKGMGKAAPAGPAKKPALPGVLDKMRAIGQRKGGRGGSMRKP